MRILLNLGVLTVLWFGVLQESVAQWDSRISVEQPIWPLYQADANEFPSLAADDTGRWVAVWQANGVAGAGLGADNDILFSRSDDGGASWSSPTALNTTAASDTRSDNRPRVVWMGGTVWLAVWDSYDPAGGAIGTDSDILLARSSDEGRTWSPAVPLNPDAASDTRGDYNPALATDRAGHCVAVWRAPLVASDHEIMVSHSNDGGVTWSSPAVLNSDWQSESDTDEQPEIATDGAGIWVCAWRDGGSISCARSTDNGQTWTPRTQLIPAGWDVRVASGGGAWIVACRASSGLAGTGYDGDILSVRSVDGGVTWSAPAPINNDATTDDAGDYELSIGYGGSLAGWVTTWTRAVRTNTTVFQLAVARSTDNGLTWTDPTVATWLSSNPRNPALATDGNGQWAAVWKQAGIFVTQFAIPDCNGNLVSDSTDILRGVSRDCDANGIPDECDLSRTITFTPEGRETPAETGYVGTAADFDQDGDVDVALTNWSWPNVKFFWNDGSGRFPQTTTVPVSSGSLWLAGGDLDNDGDIDLVCAMSAADRLAVLPNLGNRSFGPEVSYPVLSRPERLALTDVNHDGCLDLAATARYSRNVAVLLNRGNGTFGPPVRYDVGMEPTGLVAADLNGDGHVDLAVTDQGYEIGGPGGTISLLFGRGDGTFAWRQQLPARTCSSQIAAGDVDGDGDVDLVVSAVGYYYEGYDAVVSLLRNRGSGDFDPAELYPVGQWPGFVGLVDLNNDLRLDLLVLSTSAVSVFGNTGLGFTMQARLASGVRPDWAAIEDFDGDGNRDIGVYNDTAKTLSILLNQPTPPASSDCNLNMVPDTCELATGLSDADGDGVPDECEADCDGNGRPDIADLALGTAVDCNGNRVPDKCDLAVGSSADQDGDDVPDECEDCNSNGTVDSQDLVVETSFDCNHNHVPDECDIARGAGSDINGNAVPDGCERDCDANGVPDAVDIKPTLQYTALAPVTVGNGWRVTSSDFDNDGDVDLAIVDVVGNRLQILTNPGTGQFVVSEQIALVGTPHGLAGGDFDGDSDPDLAVTTYYPDGLTVFLNDGHGVFTMGISGDVPSSPYTIAAADFNRDGMADLAVSGSTNRVVRLLISNGDGTFAAAGEYSTPGTNRMRTADLNGDGFVDLMTVTMDSSRVGVFMNQGDGTFAPYRGEPDTYLGGLMDVVAADFDADGDLDLVTVDHVHNYAAISINDGSGEFTFAGHLPFKGDNVFCVAAGDVDLDGDVDVVAGKESTYGGSVGVLLNQGNLEFANPIWLDSVPVFDLLLADIDRQDNLDVVAVHGQSTVLTAFTGRMVAAASDCNANGFMDACEQPDCNSNRVPDDCEADTDADGFIDACDFCPEVPHWNNVDSDEDGYGDPCDNCPLVANLDQADTDADGRGDACDEDLDGDGAANATDNCPQLANASQDDGDGDGVGDACDECPNTFPGIPADSSGCSALIKADFDRDGDVDQTDFGHLQTCLSGSGVPQNSPACQDALLDADVDVDANELSIFLGCLRGPGVPGDPSCVP